MSFDRPNDESDGPNEAKAHWERAYGVRPDEAQSWYQPDPALSLALITQEAESGASVLDVGGGTSLLVDELLARGYRPSVLDIAGNALELSKARLGERAAGVEWFEGDVTTFDSPHPWDVWHDRAVFHFLTDPKARAAYAEVAARSIRPGGAAIIATFALTGPERCSGLPTVRYDGASLAVELGASFRLEDERWETHRTPDGREQDFLYCVFRRGR